MNANEPVAWIDPRELDMAVSTSVTKNKMFDTDIPLYTYPVDAVNISEQYVDKTQNNRHDLGISYAIGFDDGFKAGMQRAVEINTVRDLTDEEIAEVINEHGWRGLTGYLLTFAHAILRKAQEK